MPTLPLSFLVPILLTILLVRLARQRNWPAVLFMGLCTVVSLVSAVRWSFNWEGARLLQPALAVLIPPAAWRCFSRVKESRGKLWAW